MPGRPTLLVLGDAERTLDQGQESIVTTTPMSHIEPTDAQVTTLIADAQESAGPVTMLNLLRFDGDAGRASYERYAREVQTHLDRVGASVVYSGATGQTIIGDGDDTWWDAIVVVTYPSRAAFVEMVLDPGYQEISVYRTRALTNSALVANDVWDVEL